LRSTTTLGARHLGDIPFGYWSTAQGGINSQHFFASLTNVLAVARPSFVVLPGWTFNDVTGNVHADRAAVDSFFARLLMAAETCVSHGAAPIFLTPFPRDPGAMVPAQIEPWRDMRTWILALREAAGIVIDATPILGHVSDGQLDGTFLPEYSDDQIHPNDLGHAAIADKLTPIIERLCGISSD
jgi:hypothetical protein